MRYRVLPFQGVDQPTQLARCHGQRLCIVGVLWPVEATFFLSTVVQPEAVRIPTQDLDPVAAPVTEHEPMLADRIEPEYLCHYQRQSVDRLAHVVVTCGEVHHGLRRAPHQRNAITTAPSHSSCAWLRNLIT